jgi:hypothetical protein
VTQFLRLFMSIGCRHFGSHNQSKPSLIRFDH